MRRLTNNFFFRFFEDLLSKCELTLRFSLGLHNIKDLDYDRENILICGEMGSGKTTICQILMNQVQKPPYFIHTHVIECKPLKGKFTDENYCYLQKSVMNFPFYSF